MATTQVELTASSIRELAKALSTAMTPAGNAAAMGRQPAGQRQSSRGDPERELVNKTQKELKKEISELTKAAKDLEKLAKIAKKDPKQKQKARSLEREANSIRHKIKVNQEYVKVMHTGTKQIYRTAEARKKEAEAVKQVRESMLSFAQRITNSNGILDSTKQIVTDYRKSLQTGLDLNYTTNALLGMNQEQILQLEKDFRRVSNALGTEGREFVGTINQLQNDLYAFTGEAGASAQLAANMQMSARLIGLAGDDAQKYVSGTMLNTFKVFNSNLSMTADEFGNLLNSLSSDRDIRLEMLRVQKGQRGAVMDSVLALNKYYLSLGYATSEAEQLTKQFVKMRGGDPVERIRNAAKLRAFGGAMGMSGAESQRMMQLSMMTQAQLSAIPGGAEELAKLKANLGGRAREGMGQGLGSEIFISKAMAGLGIADQMNTSAIDTLQKQTLEQTGVMKGDVKERNVFFTESLQYMDNISAILTSGFAGLAASLVVAGGRGMFSGKLDDIISKGGKGKDAAVRGAKGAGGRLGKGVGAGAKFLGKNALKALPIGGIIAGGITLASMEGSIGKNKETFKAAGEIGGTAAGMAAGAAIGSIVPGLGTVLGAAIGAGLGYFGADIGEMMGESAWDYFKDESEKTTDKQQRVLLESNEALAKLQSLTGQQISMQDLIEKRVSYGQGSAEQTLINEALGKYNESQELERQAKLQRQSEVFGNIRDEMYVTRRGRQIGYTDDVSAAFVKENLNKIGISPTQLKDLGMQVAKQDGTVTEDERLAAVNLEAAIRSGNTDLSYGNKRLLDAIIKLVEKTEEQTTTQVEIEKEKMLNDGPNTKRTTPRSN